MWYLPKNKYSVEKHRPFVGLINSLIQSNLNMRINLCQNYHTRIIVLVILTIQGKILYILSYFLIYFSFLIRTLSFRAIGWKISSYKSLLKAIIIISHN